MNYFEDVEENWTDKASKNKGQYIICCQKQNVDISFGEGIKGLWFIHSQQESPHKFIL